MPDSVSQTEVEIRNPNGLHMKPAMQLVDTASQFNSDISVSNGDISVDAKSIMHIAMLAATTGTKLTITAKGPDAQDAIDALKDLIENKLCEDYKRKDEGKSTE
ncbi:MAG: HPr family phosphocarrier protein [Sedimentisphaerales bacterium]|nr:HPr family phosphocarrier protein [Sedimentisphaerales bacterium]